VKKLQPEKKSMVDEEDSGPKIDKMAQPTMA